jgi:hypothetical protein
MKFTDLYNNTAKSLNLLQEEDLEAADVVPVVDTETQSTSSPEISQLDVEEENAQKIIWIEKIVKLLTLLNRKDPNVEKLIDTLTQKDTNSDTLAEKEKTINNLISTINPASAQ